MTRLYWTKTHSLPDPEKDTRLLDLLPAERQTDVLRAESETGRKLRLGAGILLDRVFKESGVAFEKISYGAHGKPRAEGIFFNLSHSKERAYLAVSEGEVGCDAEKVQKIPEHILKRFSRMERMEVFKEASERGREEAFFLLWTKKESFLKMIGESAGRIFETSIENGGVIFGGERAECAIQSFLHAGYAVSVCTEREEAVEIEEIDILGEKFPKKFC